MTRRPGTSGGRRKPRSATITLTAEEVEQIASDAAEQALSRFMLTLGIDTTSAEGVINAQRDFQHLHAWRRSIETVKRQGIVAAVGVIVVGLIAMVWQRISNTTGPP